jgi:hypothetical protein
MHSSNWSSPICSHEIRLVDSIKQIPYHVLMGIALHQVEVLGDDHHFQWMMACTGKYI